MKQTQLLGARLRMLRKERHLTQRDLANRAGISVNAVSLIERNEISPSVSTLQSLAGALNVKISYFFADEEQTSVIHVKSAARPLLQSGGVTIGGLGSQLSGQQFEPFLMTLQPDAGSGEPVVHLGHEFVYCLQGQITYEIGKDVYLLDQGDTLLFEARFAHRWHNPTQEVAQMLLILEAPDEFHRPARQHFPDYPSLTHLGLS
jgi:transcriptional regulator with XRE-family HTH domain